ncbi:hypothetical protein Nepgr_020416 [Nepenthes gracilis]|uniref:Uncharacterized protein n=1 Tax=Nepenthes gracilis TaxID=150966 RepID=A0AAD3SVA3_NEPGR|nr:hypothetical protein Nepgr_020416 [Nepenthes gracilis]
MPICFLPVCSVCSSPDLPEAIAGMVSGNMQFLPVCSCARNLADVASLPGLASPFPGMLERIQKLLFFCGEIGRAVEPVLRDLSRNFDDLLALKLNGLTSFKCYWEVQMLLENLAGVGAGLCCRCLMLGLLSLLQMLVLLSIDGSSQFLFRSRFICCEPVVEWMFSDIVSAIKVAIAADAKPQQPSATPISISSSIGSNCRMREAFWVPAKLQSHQPHRLTSKPIKKASGCINKIN